MTNWTTESEIAQRIDPMMKTQIASRNTFYAPNRSDIHPLIGMNIASATI
jgi:hypothetical protein